MTKQFGTPGPRAIHPEMCDSPSLGRCGLLANLLLPRLVAQADDQGRLQGSAQAVLVSCMPRLLSWVTVDGVEEALRELEGEGMLQRYPSRGEVLLQLSSWWTWQNSMRRAYPSRWPAPPGWRDLVYGNAVGGAATFEEVVAASPRRNAAIRGVLPQSAAIRGTRVGPRAGPDAGACVGARGRRVPNRAVPKEEDVAPAPAGAARGGPMSSAAEAAGGYVAKLAAQRGGGS